MIRVVIPAHLKTLSGVKGEVELNIKGELTIKTLLDAIEFQYPMLKGTIREHVTFKRRPFLRFFACQEDLSHDSPDKPLPKAVADGKEPFMIVGSVAGG